MHLDLSRAIEHLRAQGRAVLITRKGNQVVAIESFPNRMAAIKAASAKANRIIRAGLSFVIESPSVPVADTSFERRRMLLDNPEE